MGCNGCRINEKRTDEKVFVPFLSCLKIDSMTSNGIGGKSARLVKEANERLIEG